MILDPIVESSSALHINFYLRQGEDFDPVFISYTDISKKRRTDFFGYAAELVIYDDSDPEIKIEKLTTDNRGVSLYDGEIRIFIPAFKVNSYTFDRAQYTLRLFDTYGDPHVFMTGLVYIKPGERHACRC